MLHSPGSSVIFSRLSVLLSADWSLPTELMLGEGERERGRAGRGSERENFLSLNTGPSLVGLHSHLLLCEMPPTHSAAPQHCDLKPLKWDASREREKVSDRKRVGDPRLGGWGSGEEGRRGLRGGGQLQWANQWMLDMGEDRAALAFKGLEARLSSDHTTDADVFSVYSLTWINQTWMLVFN